MTPTAASYPQRGGGVSSKIVKLGDTYGDLPVPTRTGYSFVGWRGRNLINLFEMQKDKTFWTNFTNNSASENIKNIDSNTITVGESNPQNFSNVCLGYITDMLEVGKEYLLAYDFSFTKENTACVGIDGIDMSTEVRVQDTVTKFVVLANTKYFIKFYVNTSNSSVSGDCTNTYYNIMLTKLSNTNERVYYEPYYIDCNTTFSNPYDRTLVAEWTENSKNLFTNGDFEDVYTQTDTGWDNSLNGTLHATSWDDYNPAVDNPEVGYHAHIKDLSATDLLHGHVYEYNAVDTRWLGISQILNLSNGTFMFTAQVYRVSGANRMRAAAWYSRASDGVGTHGSTNRIFLEEMAVGKWVTVRGYFTIDDNMNSRFEYYFYGSESDVGIFYLDNVFLAQIS